MTITATRTPAILSATNFKSQAKVVDPADGTEQLAHTEYHVDLPSLSTRTVDGRKALAETFAIKITPVAKLKTGTTLTTELREHEQFHYDVGFVVARRVATLLTALRADSVDELTAKFDGVIRLHFKTRNNLIQRRYDLDTHHGTQKHYQAIWQGRMATCLGDSNATQIGGFYL